MAAAGSRSTSPTSGGSKCPLDYWFEGTPKVTSKLKCYSGADLNEIKEKCRSVLPQNMEFGPDMKKASLVTIT